MTKKQTHMSRFWRLYALAIASIILLAIARIFLSPTESTFDWPSWVQAVGSVSAIVAAIFVSSDQAEQQRQRDLVNQREEMDGVLRCLRVEVKTTLLYIQTQVGEAIVGVPRGEPIRVVFPLPEYPFPIFDGLIPKLGGIHNAQLQEQIIFTFTLAKSLAMTAGAHNSLVEALAIAEARFTDTLQFDAGQEASRALEALIRYGASLRQSFHAAHAELDSLHTALIEACPDIN